MSNFNSRKIEYKNPFGAVKTEQKVTFTFPVADRYESYGVRFCYRKQNKTFTRDMAFVGRGEDYANYTLTISFDEVGIYWYRFEVLTKNGVMYGGKGVDGECKYGEWLPEWQLTVYDKDFSTPDKYKCGVIYHVFVDRFAKSKKVKPTKPIHEDWYELPNIVSADGKYHGDDFFGGNLEGIREKLPYIKSLGVNILYLSPIFEAASNHRYDTGDFMKIDSLLGTEKDFVKLCKSAKKLGISIMLDGVFNHTGSDSKYFNKHGTYDTVGAYNDKSSEYFDWYYFDEYPEVYKAWWGIQNVPTLNKDNAEYRKLVFGEGGVIDKWTSLGASAWRLDVVDELPTDFVQEIRKTVKSKKSDALIIGEVWEDASTKESYGKKRSYLFGHELDGVMNYPYMNAILSFCSGGDKKEFERAVMSIAENYPKPVLDVLMNFLDTHDTVRAMNVFSGVRTPDTRWEQKKRTLSQREYELAKKRLKMAAVLEYTLLGNPSIFYGDEAGVTGWRDPLNRVTYPWGREDVELIDFYRALGKMRGERKCEFEGGIEFEQGEVLIYRRGEDKKITVLANNGENPVSVKIRGKDIINNQPFEGIVPPITALVIEEE